MPTEKKVPEKEAKDVPEKTTNLEYPDKRIPTLEELLKAGVHFGHSKGRWNPKAGKYIYGERNGVHIIDLQKTVTGLEKALDRIREIAKKKGSILFLGTKKQACRLVEEAARETDMPYVTERWLGGTFTNFKTILRRMKKLLDVEDREKQGELKKYTKKEQLQFKKEIADFEKKMGGIKKMNKLPEAIFIIGVKEENTAVREAKKTGVDVIALADTNIDPEDLDFPIPSNDDAVSTIKLMLGCIVKEIKDNK